MGVLIDLALQPGNDYIVLLIERAALLKPPVVCKTVCTLPWLSCLFLFDSFCVALFCFIVKHSPVFYLLDFLTFWNQCKFVLAQALLIVVASRE